MEAGYRKPKIEEFVQGFKFEVLITHSFGFIFLGEDRSKDLKETKTTWEKVEVWWKNEPDALITQTTDDGETITATGAFMNFFAPYSDKQLEKLLEEDKVRVKI